MSPYVAKEPQRMPRAKRRRLSKKAALIMFGAYAVVAGAAVWFLPPIVAKYALQAAKQAVGGPR